MSEDTGFSTIEYRRDGPVAFLYLNRPDKLNAINGQMICELNQALDAAESDDGIRVIVLCGNGRAFSAGFDLDVDTAAAGNNVAFWRQELRADFDVIMRFWDSPKPTIAAVHGYCLGSAMEMAVACDIAIAGSDCRFGAPEVCFGSGIVSLLLPWVIGVKAAKELLLTGIDKLPAGRALEIGLVNRVVEHGRHVESAACMALEIARNDRLAVMMTKQAINRSFEIMGMRQALLQALELDVLVETTDTPESRQFNRLLKNEGVKAALAWREKKLGGGE